MTSKHMQLKFVLIGLCMLLLLSGCGRLFTKPAEMTPPTDLGGMSLVWKEAAQYIDQPIPYQPSKYQPEIPAYQISADLSNLVNIDKFSGFSEEQQQKLSENGFVVLEPNSDRAYFYMKMYPVYEENDYKRIPSFVTTDVALHMYHKFFDETLKQLEKEQLHAALQQLTTNMLNKSLKLYALDANQPINEYLRKNIIYFSVANQLINDSYGDIPNELLSVAEQELALISDASSYASSPLLGWDINYAQFKPRGHYAGDDLLESYFKTMMWYGLIGFPFDEESADPNYQAITQSLLMTYTAFLEADGVNDIELWDKIYSPTNFFVGQADDITLFDIQKVIQDIYGTDVHPSAFADSAYHKKLIAALQALPEPQIQHKLITGAVDTPTGKQFRFMGQRYTLDANVMQDLMVPIFRPVPTGLDVATAFGNERAESIILQSGTNGHNLQEDYLQKITPDKYKQLVQPLKDKVAALTIADWQQNLYNGWLWALEAVWQDKKGNPQDVPFYMQNQAWQDKQLQTGLGSYAELKHDTILYSKQPAAEKGGGEELQEFLPNFVEPNVEVYDRLLWLVKYSRANLEKRDLLTENAERVLGHLEDLYNLLIVCSVKQLENIPLTEQENEALKYIGGRLENIDILLSDLDRKQISSAIVSDVAGIADTGEFLEVATGLPHEIYVALPYEGKVYLSRGTVYSYYEFLNGTPLTDREWHEMIGVETIEQEGWQYEQINPDKILDNPIPQPSWVQSFHSTEPNKVSIKDVEYRIE